MRITHLLRWLGVATLGGYVFVGFTPFANVLAVHLMADFELAPADAVGFPVNRGGGLVIGFNSKHPSGANLLFCDGAVHFLSENINGLVWEHLAQRNDNVPATVP